MELPRIDSSDLARLERTIVSSFTEFCGFLDEDPWIDRGLGWTIPDSLWTCFMLGRSKNHDLPGWNGILERWLNDCRGLNRDPRRKCRISRETWYRLDLAVVDESEGNWWSGKYRLVAAVEHENQPRELRGHLRQLYDLCADVKLLVIWSTLAPDDLSEMKSDFESVQRWCEARAIGNHGPLWVGMGDWRALVPQLRSARFTASFLSWLSVPSR